MINSNLLISPELSIKQALRVLNKTAMKALFVIDGSGHLLGSLTDGDIRRALLRDVHLESSIAEVYNTNPIVLHEGTFSGAEVKELFLGQRVELIPILDVNWRITDILAWNDYLSEKKIDVYLGPPIGVPVIIMAGGKGTRLAPFTNVLPKPLIPIGEKTILELIMAEFIRYGVDDFIITLNYRGEMIKAYFSGQIEKYPIRYILEDDFYGTAGSLSLVAPEIRGTFIVSNCDIIVKANFADALKFHRNSGASLTVISSLQHHKIPYGVVDFKPGGEVIQITEKPEFTYPINTGVYILEKECLDLVPPKTLFHMTHLIDALLATGKKVVTYPVNEGQYIDIGQWEEYRQAIKSMEG